MTSTGVKMTITTMYNDDDDDPDDDVSRAYES